MSATKLLFCTDGFPKLSLIKLATVLVYVPYSADSKAQLPVGQHLGQWLPPSPEAATGPSLCLQRHNETSISIQISYSPAMFSGRCYGPKHMFAVRFSNLL